MDYKFKTMPYEHQLKALGASWNKEAFALFMEMGTGKSKVLIDNIAMLYDKGKINGALVIAPKGVYRNWEQSEIPTHMPEHVNYHVVIWSPKTTKSNLKQLSEMFTIKGKLVIFLMNIDAFATKKGIQIAQKFLNGFVALMAVDESTTIKSPTAQRTKNLIKLRQLAKYRRILTGSPVTKSPMDLYTQSYFLDPYFLDFSSFYTFKARYCQLVNRNMGSHSFKQIIGYQRLDELNHKVDQYSYRVLKSDCLDLPDKVFTKRIVEMTPEQAKMYETMKREAIAEIEGKETSVTTMLAQLVKLHQIVCGSVIVNDGEVKEIPNNRIGELLNCLEEIDGKVIIWAVYRHDIKKITQTLAEKYGAETVVSFFGDTKAEERQEAVKNFQDMNNPIRFFVGNPRTGGFGLTLTAAHHMIYYSNSYDLEIRLQSEDRAHRIGQTNKVTYIDLVTEKTVDEKIIKSLRNKIDLATKVLGEDYKEWLV
jgi:SNF2 family DNA or RNA helicase